MLAKVLESHINRLYNLTFNNHSQLQLVTVAQFVTASDAARIENILVPARPKTHILCELLLPKRVLSNTALGHCDSKHGYKKIQYSLPWMSAKAKAFDRSLSLLGRLLLSHFQSLTVQNLHWRLLDVLSSLFASRQRRLLWSMT